MGINARFAEFTLWPSVNKYFFNARPLVLKINSDCVKRHTVVLRCKMFLCKLNFSFESRGNKAGIWQKCQMHQPFTALH